MTARVIIVGAGPAGIRAAETLAAAGLRPLVIDEGHKAGGQIYRRPPEGFIRPPEKLYGDQATKAVALHRCFDTLIATDRVVFLSRQSVVAIAGGQVHVLGQGGQTRHAYDRLILATGASDRVLPVPGWQAPGVYTLGAAQIALKAQGLALGRRIVLAGSGPLLTLVAAQLLEAGAKVAAVLDTARRRDQARGLPGMLARPGVVLRGLALRRKIASRYHGGVTLRQVAAGPDGPTAVHWHDSRGRAHVTPCDTVALGWHLRAETHLADLAGCTFQFDATWDQWLPRADAEGRAGNGVYLAGDGLCILGADGAEVAGRLAAAACLSDLGLPVPDTGRDMRRLKVMQRFANGIARAFPLPADTVGTLDDDTIVCRCENVTAGEIRAACTHVGPEANRTKAISRVGMGRCQGRYCQIAAAAVISAHTGADPEGVGRLRGQAPARPLPMSAACAPEGSTQ